MKRLFNILLALTIGTFCQAQNIKLELNLIKGETYTQNLNSNMLITQSVNGQEIKTDMILSALATYKVTGVQNSIYELEVNYESLAMKMKLPTGLMEYNSEKTDANDVVSTLLGTLKNKPFNVRMTKTGKVVEVKNIDNLFNGMFDKLTMLSESQKQQIQNQLMQAYGEKGFKGNLEMSTAIFPDKVVAKGDKWVVITNLESSLSAKVESTYELIEINESNYRISGSSKIETLNKDAYFETNGMSLKVELKGTMTSDIVISLQTGWAIESRINQFIEGTTQIKDNPKLPSGMTIPMSMKNEMTITAK